jgi:hypothetical protein
VSDSNGCAVSSTEVREVANVLLAHLKNLPRGHETRPLVIVSAQAYLLGRALRASGLAASERNLDLLVNLIELGYLEHEL